MLRAVGGEFDVIWENCVSRGLCLWDTQRNLLIKISLKLTTNAPVMQSIEKKWIIFSLKRNSNLFVVCQLPSFNNKIGQAFVTCIIQNFQLSIYFTSEKEHAFQYSALNSKTVWIT